MAYGDNERTTPQAPRDGGDGWYRASSSAGHPQQFDGSGRLRPVSPSASASFPASSPESTSLSRMMKEDTGGRGAHVRGSSAQREVIDARGSIDSRTFNETHEISSTTKDDRDRHAAELDSISHTSWRSRAGQGFDAVPDAGASRRLSSRAGVSRPGSNIGFSGGVMTGSANYGRAGGSSRAVLVVLGLVALILVAVIAFLLLR